MSAVYLLPFHKDQLVEGWQISGIGSWISGAPFSVTSLTRADGGSTALPNWAPNNPGCNGSAYTGVPAQEAVNRYLSGVNTGQFPNGLGSSIIGGATNSYLNPNCFTLPAPGEIGDMGRDTFTGPGCWDIDTSVFKGYEGLQDFGELHSPVLGGDLQRDESSVLFKSVGDLVDFEHNSRFDFWWDQYRWCSGCQQLGCRVRRNCWDVQHAASNAVRLAG